MVNLRRRSCLYVFLDEEKGSIFVTLSFGGAVVAVLVCRKVPREGNFLIINREKSARHRLKILTVEEANFSTNETERRQQKLYRSKRQLCAFNFAIWRDGSVADSPLLPYKPDIDGRFRKTKFTIASTSLMVRLQGRILPY